jgi:hypothetical protein
MNSTKDKKVKSSDDKYGCGLSHPRARMMYSPSHFLDKN